MTTCSKILAIGFSFNYQGNPSVNYLINYFPRMRPPGPWENQISRGSIALMETTNKDATTSIDGNIRGTTLSGNS